MDTQREQYHRGVESECHPNIRLRRWDRAKASSKRVYVRQPEVACVQMGAHNNSLPNLLRALNERVFNVEKTVNGNTILEPTPKPPPEKMAWKRMSKLGKQLARDVRVRVPHVQRLTCDEFVEQCPAHKRSLYAQASAQLRQRGWGPTDARVSSFVKFEKLKFAESGPKSDPCPRVIQPRSPVFNVALGRYTRRIEEELYRALNTAWEVDDGEKVVMKGLSVEEVAAQLRRKWDSFLQPCAIGLDASRFDQHVSREALAWEHQVYLDIFDRDAELGALLKHQLRNIGIAFVDGVRVDYETDGCRMSGDMNTSLGNCLIMSALVLLYCKERGVEAKLANNGDDCLVFMDRRAAAKFRGDLEGWFLDFGFNIQVEPLALVFERCEFCQSRPVWSGHEWVMVRNPQVALAKDVMGLACGTSEEYLKWIHAVGTGGMSLFGDMPCFGALYSRMRKCGKPSRVARSLLLSDSGFMRMSTKPRTHARDNAVSDECRISFYRAFGICPDVQIEFERLCTILNFDQVITDPGVGMSYAPPLTDHLGNPESY